MNEPQSKHENAGGDPRIQAGLPPHPAEALAPGAEEPIVYRPISGFAVAGFAAGALFVLFVVACALVALSQRAPMFLPLWLLGVAALGLIFSWLGERHVRNSEGTRAGASLAKWGFRLSLVSGLIYFAYFFVTGETLKSQANAFLMEKGDDSGFFPTLIEGAGKQIPLNTAFLLTRPQRGGRPENERDMRLFFDAPSRDGGSGELTRFREGIFGRLFYKDLAKDAKVEPLAAQDWVHEKGSYKIYRNYLIKTKEVELVMRMAVASAEAESGGQGRRWFVNLTDSQEVSKQFTDLGQGVQRLRRSAGMWLDQHMAALRNGKALAEMKDADQSPWDQLITDPKKRSDFRETIHSAFAAKGNASIYRTMILTKPSDPGKWEQVGGKIRFGLMMQFEFAKSPTDRFTSECVVFVESRQAIDPARFMEDDAAPNWQVVSFILTMTVPQKGP